LHVFASPTGGGHRRGIAGEFMTKDINLDTLMEKMVRVADTGSLD
jgi:hypothetical protein